MPPRAPKRTRHVLFTPSAPPEPVSAVPFSAEILLEMLSHLDTEPIDSPRRDYSNHLPACVFERTDALRALSQTCRAWRLLCLPLLWANVEIGAARTGPGHGTWHQQLVNSLINKSLAFEQNPSIAKLVRGLRIGLPKTRIDATLTALIRCLYACPNLKTLNFYFVAVDINSTVKNAFKGETFPGIETVALPSQAHWALRSFPNVKRVVISTGRDENMQILKSIKAACKKVEVLEGIQGPDTAAMTKKAIEVAPNLREISYHTFAFAGYGDDDGKNLALLKKLKNIRAVSLSYFGTHIDDDLAIQRSAFMRKVFGGTETSVRALSAPIPEAFLGYGPNTLEVTLHWQRS